MNVFLLHPDRDIDLAGAPASQAQTLTEDLELEVLIAAMADGDEFLSTVARRVLLASLTDPAVIGYRQQVLADVLAHPSVVRKLYDIAVDAVHSRCRVHAWPITDRPEALLARSVEVMQLLLGGLRRLCRLADDHADELTSPGFVRLFATVADQLDDGLLAAIDAHLAELRLPRGVLLSAALGPGNLPVRRRLHRPAVVGWRERITGRPAGTGSSSPRATSVAARRWWSCGTRPSTRSSPGWPARSSRCSHCSPPWPSSGSTSAV
jgi:hypothetical protein